MNIFRNFSLNTKLTEKQSQLSKDFNVLFLCDEQGNDWYECQNFFGFDTWKVLVNNDFRVVSYSKDVSSFFPLNESVIEVSDIPSNLSISDAWYYDFTISGFKINEIVQSELKRDSLILSATLKMASLFQAQEDGDITKEEVGYLMEMKGYRAALRRLSLDSAQLVDWPTEPKSL